MAHVVVAYVVMAHVVMAHVVMAYVVMTYVGMAYYTANEWSEDLCDNTAPCRSTCLPRMNVTANAVCLPARREIFTVIAVGHNYQGHNYLSHN